MPTHTGFSKISRLSELNGSKNIVSDSEINEQIDKNANIFHACQANSMNHDPTDYTNYTASYYINNNKLNGRKKQHSHNFARPCSAY